ncbi:hypothetical protein V1504DRAFT_471262 [Lipomyces starkeyi]
MNKYTKNSQVKSGVSRYIRAQSKGNTSQVVRHRTDLQPMFGLLSAAFLNKEAIDKMGKPWVLETPCDNRDAAMDDLLKAYDSAHARYKKDNKVLKIKHRSRTKCRQESIVIHHKHWSHGTGKYAFLPQNEER